MQQKKIWKSFWDKCEDNLKDALEVKEYHLDLKKIIEQFQNKNDIIEIGCGTGITSLILDDRFKKNLLDYDENIINFAKQLFEKENKKAIFINEDIFSNTLVEKSYDIVFNSGLMEHYDKETRIRILKEFKRILKNDGCIIIAIPNHYCIPYRMGYIILRLLNMWPYPKEYKIKNFDTELKMLNLITEKNIICAKNILKDSIRNKVLKSLYEIFTTIFGFEGYLRVFIIKKDYVI